MLFRDAIYDSLKEMEKNQAWLAKEAGVDRAVISRYMNRKRIPRADMFMMICKILHIDPLSIEF